MFLRLVGKNVKNQTSKNTQQQYNKSQATPNIDLTVGLGLNCSYKKQVLR